MFKNKLWFLIVAGLVATSTMTAGLAHAEVCVQNDSELSEQQLSVAFTATKDAAQQNSDDWHQLANGKEYCQGSNGRALYFALYIKPLISDQASYTSTQTIYIADQAIIEGAQESIGFSVQLYPDRTPKVYSNDNGAATVQVTMVAVVVPPPPAKPIPPPPAKHIRGRK